MNLWNSFFGKIITTLFISMIPVIELRGAIPIAVANGLDYRIAIAVSIVGNIIPVPFIIIFIRKIFAFLRKISSKLDTLVTKLEKRAEKKSDVVQRYAFWGLFVLVAIPLPGTGAWTGALVAAMLDMRLKKALPAIALGVVAAGVIVAFVTYGTTAIFF
ncbi:MAG: small multi-drug export protein [Clostridia bacterium]|nr:small multi-drug export protein [Clostridia bacterium]